MSDKITHTTYTIYGWTFDQWSRVLALHDGYPKTHKDFLMAQKEWKKRNLGEPVAKSPLIGVDPPMDYDAATRLFMLKPFGDGLIDHISSILKVV